MSAEAAIGSANASNAKRNTRLIVNSSPKFSSFPDLPWNLVSKV
jgi:hypothetical protein